MKQRTDLGATVFEVVAALFVVTTGILAVLRIYDVSAERLRTSSENEIALRAMQNELEHVWAFPESVPESGEHVFASHTPELSELYLQHSVLRISPHPKFPGLLGVSAEVSWIAESGRRVDRSIATVIRGGTVQ